MRSSYYYFFCLFLLWQPRAGGETLAQEHNIKGAACLRDRNFEAAEKEFREAIRAEPEYAPAHNNLGFTLYQEAIANSGKVDGSRGLQPAHQNERRINPAAVGTLINEALDHLQTALKHAGGRKNIIRQAKENLALLYTDTSINLSTRGADWNKKGIEIYKSLLKEEPDNPEYHMRLGFAYFNAANPGGGFSELDKASTLARGKDTLWIHKELQKFYMQINFTVNAVKEQEIVMLEQKQEGGK